MTIRFILLVNKQGQTRVAQYYEYMRLEERRALEGEIVRKCLARSEQQCSFVEHRNYKVIYRRYASLFFLVGVDGEEFDSAAIPSSTLPLPLACNRSILLPLLPPLFPDPPHSPFPLSPLPLLSSCIPPSTMLSSERAGNIGVHTLHRGNHGPILRQRGQ
ncbi:unnamed protein product [Closterium sp. NIES-54]